MCPSVNVNVGSGKTGLNWNWYLLELDLHLEPKLYLEPNLEPDSQPERKPGTQLKRVLCMHNSRTGSIRIGCCIQNQELQPELEPNVEM